MDGLPFPAEPVAETRLVMFGLPCYSRYTAIGFTLSLVQTENLLNTCGIHHGYIPCIGDPYLSKARNHIATLFLEEYPDATDLFFIDDDVSWPAEAILRVLAHPADIVAGVYPKKKDTMDFPVEMAGDSDTGDLIEWGGALQARWAATGFLRIKRCVLETLAQNASRYDEPDIAGVVRSMYYLFEMGLASPSGPEGKKEWWGEDVAFGFKANAAGFSTYVIPDIEFGHQGAKVWTGNFAKSVAAWRSARETVKEAAE